MAGVRGLGSGWGGHRFFGRTPKDWPLTTPKSWRRAAHAHALGGYGIHATHTALVSYRGDIVRVTMCPQRPSTLTALGSKTLGGVLTVLLKASTGLPVRAREVRVISSSRACSSSSAKTARVGRDGECRLSPWDGG